MLCACGQTMEPKTETPSLGCLSSNWLLYSPGLVLIECVTCCPLCIPHNINLMMWYCFYLNTWILYQISVSNSPRCSGSIFWYMMIMFRIPISVNMRLIHVLTGRWKAAVGYSILHQCVSAMTLANDQTWKRLVLHTYVHHKKQWYIFFHQVVMQLGQFQPS